ncbi:MULTISPECIES: hypothetical protein [unclassified Variovorax]|uniref:hypothetical protein n=1 Tax=unclassified Variovorax TaxID=663243 RepID=UPI0025772677|nr:MULTISPECIES: hypothetical protein [unclassified Variovorax]MDM0086379.1 hypothetical protein [Variovorax sp. J22G40]MDM0145364.1 hypothetical protein [Variovorax sp. J2P1-31]
MPSRNKKLSFEQRVSAVEWEARAEKLSHFLRGSPGHPALEPHEIPPLFDEVEAALLDLRRAFELMPPPRPVPMMQPHAPSSDRR